MAITPKEQIMYCINNERGNYLNYCVSTKTFEWGSFRDPNANGADREKDLLTCLFKTEKEAEVFGITGKNIMLNYYFINKL